MWADVFQMPHHRQYLNVVCNFSFFICYISLLCDEKHQQNIFKAVIQRSIFYSAATSFQGDPILLGRQKFVNVTSRLQKQKSVHTTRGLAKCLATECVFQLFVHCVSFGSRRRNTIEQKLYLQLLNNNQQQLPGATEGYYRTSPSPGRKR